MAKRRRHTPEQVIRKLREGERMLGEGSDLAAVCKHLEVSEQTWHRWLNQYGGMKAETRNASRSWRSRTPGSRSWSPSRPWTSTCSRSCPGKLLSPERRRRAVVLLVAMFGVSQRRACRVTGQHCSTQRLTVPVASDAEQQLRARLRAIAKKHPRWGWRKAHAIARREGLVVNRKRTRRLWREEGLKRPPRARKRRRVGEQRGIRIEAARPDLTCGRWTSNAT